jgi:hypothetical protein
MLVAGNANNQSTTDDYSGNAEQFPAGFHSITNWHVKHTADECWLAATAVPDSVLLCHQAVIAEVGKLAHLAKAKIEAIDKMNEAAQQKKGQGLGSASERTRTSIAAGTKTMAVVQLQCQIEHAAVQQVHVAAEGDWRLHFIS